VQIKFNAGVSFTIASQANEKGAAAATATS
jgi:hypothetical protein